MIKIEVDEPSKKEIRDAIERLRELLIVENKNKENCLVGFANKTVDKVKPKKKEYNERISVVEEWIKTFADTEKILAKNIGRCNSRLGRQGKDIYTLWKKVEELERKEIKLFNMIKGLIRYLDLNFFTRLTEKGDEVKFEKRAKNNISEMYNKPGILDKRKRKVLEENIDCILNQIIRKRNENN